MITHADFTAALMDPAAPAPGGLIAPDGGPAGKRFDIYRNNVASSLIDAMRTGFPVVERLIGAKNFGTLALMYVRAHPPVSPVLMFYGADFPAFVEGFEPLSALPYLPDVARLELARRGAYHAADAPVLTQSDFAAMGEAGLMAMTLSPHPAARIVASAYPIHDIWLRNSGVDDHPIDQAAQHVLLTRPGLDVQMSAITPAVAAFFDGLATQTMGAAIEAALSQTPDFPLPDVFAILMHAGFAARSEKDPT